MHQLITAPAGSNAPLRSPRSQQTDAGNLMKQRSTLAQHGAQFTGATPRAVNTNVLPSSASRTQFSLPAGQTLRQNIMSYTDTPFDQLIPPPLEINNTHRDDSVGIAIVVTGIVASFSVFARLGQRFASKSLGADDYAIIPAVVRHILSSRGCVLKCSSCSTSDGRRWRRTSTSTLVLANPSAT